MRPVPLRSVAATLAFLACVPSAIAAATPQDADPRLEALKVEALELVEGRAKLVQEIVDQLFSFGELGFQEFETQRYLTGLLADNGFDIELGVASMPSAWTARWGSGRPVIALGSDVDGIHSPTKSQVSDTAIRSSRWHPGTVKDTTRAKP